MLNAFLGGYGREWQTWSWRREVVNFLNGVWSYDCNLDPDVQTMPFDTELAFGDVVLWWGFDAYVGYIQKSDITVIESPPPFKIGDVLLVDNTTASVESGLIRFTKNDKIRALVIRFPHAEIWLWKKKARGDLGVWATGLQIGRPDIESDQAKTWLNDMLALVFKRRLRSFAITPEEEGKDGFLFVIEGCDEPQLFKIPDSICHKVVERLLVMAQITLEYQYAPAAGAFDLNIKSFGNFRLNVIATRVSRGYKIEVTINRIE